MSSSDISWETVGIAFAFNVVATVAIVLLAFVIIRRKYKLLSRHKFNECKLANVSLELIPRRPSERSSNVSHVTEVAQPLLGRSVSNQPPASARTQAGDAGLRSGMPPAARRTNYGDFIALWCTEHGLTEQTAQVLRDEGFNSQRAIDSLTSADVCKLSLATLSQKSLLIQIINQRDSQKQSPQHADVSTSSTSSHRDKRGSDSKSGGRSRVDSSSFKKSDDSGIDGNGKSDQSCDVSKESTNMQPASSSGRRPRSRNNSSEMDGRAWRPQIDSSGCVAGAGANYESNINANKFHGLLSDKGLYQIADDLGMEWHELACVLHVSGTKQDQFRLNYPNNAREQIVSMLRWWRDRQEGDKELVKGTLLRALQAIGKYNIAEKILKEGVHGSTSNIKYTGVF